MEFPNLHNYNFDEKKKEELIHVISVKFFEKIFNLIEDNKWVPALILSAILVSLVLILFKKNMSILFRFVYKIIRNHLLKTNISIDQPEQQTV